MTVFAYPNPGCRFLYSTALFSKLHCFSWARALSVRLCRAEKGRISGLCERARAHGRKRVCISELTEEGQNTKY